MGKTHSMLLSPLKSAGVTSLSRASTGTIEIPEGHDGRLKLIKIWALGTLETVVCAGGLVEITNDSVSGMKCHIALGGGVAVTEGGGHQNEPQIYKVDFPLVGGSTFTVYFTPYDDQNQTLHVELTYERGASRDRSRPNWIYADVPLQATVLTQVTVNEDNNEIKIPKNKGGTLLWAELLVFPTGETVMNAGGKIVIRNSVEEWKPFECFAGGFTVVGASGGGQIKPTRSNRSLPCQGNSVIETDFTPYDNQEQTLSLTVGISGVDPQG